MSKSTAVLISDIHYNLQTLQLADNSLRQAIAKANQLGVHLIIAGDTHDSKANLRGECVKAMIETIQLCKITPIIIRGNHDQINEKSEEHSLEFLRPYAYIVDKPNIYRGDKNQNYEYCIPYQHDIGAMKDILDNIPKGSRIIMHQGLQSSLSGEYVLDKSAIPINWVEEYRVISGHYHTRQDTKTGRPQKGSVGLFSYIGNPYTLNFAETSDPEKGYQILKEDGTLEFVPTNLRKHVKIEMEQKLIENTGNLEYFPNKHPGKIKNEDLVWIVVIGLKESFLNIREKMKKGWRLEQDFKLTLIPTDSIQQTPDKNLSQAELLNSLIDNSSSSDETKSRLKQTWKLLCE